MKQSNGFFVRTNSKGEHFKIDPMHSDLGKIFEKRGTGKWFPDEVQAYAFLKGIGVEAPEGEPEGRGRRRKEEG